MKLPQAISDWDFLNSNVFKFLTVIINKKLFSQIGDEKFKTIIIAIQKFKTAEIRFKGHNQYFFLLLKNAMLKFLVMMKKDLEFR